MIPKANIQLKLIVALALLTLLLASGIARTIGSPPSAGAELAPGTIITVANWTHYRQYMSDGLQALFEGRSFWHMPADLQIEVQPAESIPLPRKYLEDTNRYAYQVRLTRTADGGYVPSGYVAGLPFPHPLDGDPALIGQRIFWDSYYRYQPRVQAAPNLTYTLDRFGNMTQSSQDTTVISQLSFLSDVDSPTTIDDARGYYSVKYYQEVAPEQNKYSTVLDLVPADPTRIDELYQYVPSLRRSLRLSQAARCAPLFGSDYLIDDENFGPPGLPQLFQIDYLGPRRILVLEHADPASFDSGGGSTQLDGTYYYPGGPGLVPFPRPAMGKWEVRGSYAVSLKRLPSASNGYCYSRRVMYVDQENYFGAGQLDLYDQAGKLFKTQMVFLYPEKVPGSAGDVADLIAGSSVGFLVNFPEKHVTASVGLRSCVNAGCARFGYLDVHRYASPEALARIVR